MDSRIPDGQDQGPETSADFKRFVTKRMAVVILLVLAALWITATVAGWISHRQDPGQPVAQLTAAPAHGAPAASADAHAAGDAPEAAAHAPGAQTSAGHQAPDAGHSGVPAAAVQAAGSGTAPPARGAAEPAAHGTADHGAGGTLQSSPATSAHAAAPGHALPAADGHAAAGGHGAVEPAPSVKGVAFVDAVIGPMHHELHERFWGWRPNDILDFTDNVNNYQLGVLEVTRRTAVILAERISRAGSTESFDKNLENAMNWFMVSADRYWFPSPEGKYKDGLKELAIYRHRLKRGGARFWTRTDNLIPLLMAYEDLLGSCDENLVKAKEDDGSAVSFFAADDHFFYAKGVATALYEILHAIEKDFYATIEARRGMEVLHHAIESCHHAIEIDPIIITNSSLSGILANHRANMAAPVSHARFYLSVLIKTLST
jgi:hypothetical protein